jgi:hypothetical protein
VDLIRLNSGVYIFQNTPLPCSMEGVGKQKKKENAYKKLRKRKENGNGS